MSYTDSYNRIAAQKRLKDYEILAFACKRAGKSRDEGRSYYSTGVLYDNLGKFKDAIAQYQKFLQVCRAIGDVHGEALAYNCIGVDYMKLGEIDPIYMNDAIQYHMKHKEIAKWAKKAEATGYTVVPLQLYFSGSWIKVEIGYGRGRKQYDKRQKLKEQDHKRDVARALRSSSRDR